MKSNTPNFRFWVWHRGAWVKLTLRPDQVLRHSFSYDNGEGNSYEANEWSHEGEGVLNEWESGGSDCDGRHSENGKIFAHKTKLKEIVTNIDDGFRDFFNCERIRRPDWEKVGSVRVYDEYAQMAGY